MYTHDNPLHNVLATGILEWMCKQDIFIFCWRVSSPFSFLLPPRFFPHSLLACVYIFVVVVDVLLMFFVCLCGYCIFCAYLSVLFFSYLTWLYFCTHILGFCRQNHLFSRKNVGAHFMAKKMSIFCPKPPFRHPDKVLFSRGFRRRPFFLILSSFHITPRIYHRFFSHFLQETKKTQHLIFFCGGHVMKLAELIFPLFP